MYSPASSRKSCQDAALLMIDFGREDGLVVNKQSAIALRPSTFNQ
jgi:hypothetical protein